MTTATANQIAQLQASIARVIRGKDEVIRLSLVALLAKGHLLIEDVPGVGKTTLAQALANSFHCSFQRIQFTSDLLPSRRGGHQRVQPDRAALRFQARPDLRQHHPGGRNQPHHAENAIGAARSHERSAGDRGQPHLQAPAALHGAGHAEPRRTSRHLSACRNRSWTASSCASAWDIPRATASARSCSSMPADATRPPKSRR